MNQGHRNGAARPALLAFLFTCAVSSTGASETYRPITATMVNTTITLTGHDLRKRIPFRDVVTQPSFITHDDLAVDFLRTNAPASIYPGVEALVIPH
jgi:hypothetical protein